MQFNESLFLANSQILHLQDHPWDPSNQQPGTRGCSVAFKPSWEPLRGNATAAIDARKILSEDDTSNTRLEEGGFCLVFLTTEKYIEQP